MSPGRVALAIALFSSACSARISGGTRLGGADASSGDPIDAGDPDAGMVPAIDATPAATCASRTVFLNFDGQTLTRGQSDATTNHAEWMTAAQGTAPAYHAGNANRATEIQQIVGSVRGQLGQFPITVVTTRPPTGEYVMVVLGGNANQVGSRYSSAVNRLDCDDSRHSDVAWVGDGVTPTQNVANLVIGAIGFGLGLTATGDPSDCMCGWDNGCTPDTANACRLGAPIARDPNANQRCAGAAATQDEVATLRHAFCGP